MTTAQVVETSVTNNSLSKDYPHPDGHTLHDKQFNEDSSLDSELMTTAQVVETSVTHNSLSKDYSHPDDHIC